MRGRSPFRLGLVAGVLLLAAGCAGARDRTADAAAKPRVIVCEFRSRVLPESYRRQVGEEWARILDENASKGPMQRSRIDDGRWLAATLAEALRREGVDATVREGAPGADDAVVEGEFCPTCMGVAYGNILTVADAAFAARVTVTRGGEKRFDREYVGHTARFFAWPATLRRGPLGAGELEAAAFEEIIGRIARDVAAASRERASRRTK
jgi:hypothetical protein